MAFTDAEKAEIRLYLGWQARWAAFDGALERAVNAIGSGPYLAEENQAREILAELRRIDAALVGAEKRLKARNVGPIALNARELGDLRDRGRTFVGRLARLLGVEPKGDAFGADSFNRAGGNYQRQG